MYPVLEGAVSERDDGQVARLIVIGVFGLIIGWSLAGMAGGQDAQRTVAQHRLDNLIAQAQHTRDALDRQLAIVDSIVNSTGCHEIRTHLKED